MCDVGFITCLPLAFPELRAAVHHWMSASREIDDFASSFRESRGQSYGERERE